MVAPHCFEVVHLTFFFFLNSVVHLTLLHMDWAGQFGPKIQTGSWLKWATPTASFPSVSSSSRQDSKREAKAASQISRARRGCDSHRHQIGPGVGVPAAIHRSRRGSRSLEQSRGGGVGVATAKGGGEYAADDRVQGARGGSLRPAALRPLPPPHRQGPQTVPVT